MGPGTPPNPLRLCIHALGCPVTGLSHQQVWNEVEQPTRALLSPELSLQARSWHGGTIWCGGSSGCSLQRAGKMSSLSGRQCLGEAGEWEIMGEAPLTTSQWRWWICKAPGNRAGNPWPGFGHSSHGAFSPHRLFLAFQTTHLDAPHHQPTMMYTGLGIPNHVSTFAQQPLGPGHAHLRAHTGCMKPICCEMQESGVQSSDIYHFPTLSWLSLPTWKIWFRFHC